MSKKIIVVGSINMDLVATTERMPAPGETVHSTSFTYSPGGKGANQAVAAARLGGEVVLIGQLGQDAFAQQLFASLQAANLSTDHVDTSAGPSGCAIILVDAQGHNSIVVTAGANAMLLPERLEAQAELFHEAAVVLVQLETPLETVVCLSQITTRTRVPLVLDPAPAQRLPSALLQAITWLTPNESETASLLAGTGYDDTPLTQHNAASAARALLALGPRNVLIKMGSKGVFLAGQDTEATFIPAVQVQAVDTTAAGDAFNGAFAYALSLGQPPADAARFACAVAAFSVTQRGAQASMPTLSQMQHLLIH